MNHRSPNGAWHVVAVHAGRGPDSASRHLARRLLRAVCDGSLCPVKTRVVDLWDQLPSIYDAFAADVWDEKLRNTYQTIATADGVIAITPIVHGAYSGLFKSFVDLMGAAAWRDKPVLIGACGGTQRHCLALEHVMRPLFVCLRSVVLPTAVFAAKGECGPGRVAADVGARITRSANELVSSMAVRTGSVAPDPDPVAVGVQGA